MILKSNKKSVSFDWRKDVKIIEYYAFEYSILMRLQEIFTLKDVDMQQDIVYAKRPTRDDFGNLHDTTITRVVRDNFIRLHFQNNFHVEFSRDSLMQAYKEKCRAEDVVRRLRKYIENQWLKRIHK